MGEGGRALARLGGALIPGIALAVALAASPAATASSAAANDADVAELRRLEAVWNDAHVHGDADALDRLWAPDLTVTVPNMAVLTRADALAIARSGRLRFDRYETSEVGVRVYGEAAVVTGRMRRTRTVEGTTRDDDWRFTKVYVRGDRGWQVVAFHASPAAR